MSQINTRDHQGLITGLLSAHGLPADTVIFVDNVMEWANPRGIQEKNPFRCGMTVRSKENGKVEIWLPKRITEDMIKSVIGAMSIHGFGNSINQLSETGNFVSHLTLHEIGHALHPNFKEADCDKWAFEQMQVAG